MQADLLLTELNAHTVPTYGTKQGRRNAAKLYQILDERGEIAKAKLDCARPGGHPCWRVDGVGYAISYDSKQVYPVSVEAKS